MFFALMAVVLFSCNNEAPTEEVVEEVVVEEVIEEEVATPSAGIPNFENAELAEFTAEFGAYFDKSMELLKAGDMEGLAALEEEGKALQERGEALKNEVSEADKALLEEYLKGKATEMLSASGLDKIGEKFEKESTK